MNIQSLDEIESNHIFTKGLQLTIDDIYMWYKYGVNYQLNQSNPVVTQFPEVVIFRSLYLRQLAFVSGFSSFAEVGTARGLQSVTIAKMLNANKKDGYVITCDVVSSFDKDLKTPLTGDRWLSREEIWKSDIDFLPNCSFNFVHGDSETLANKITRRIDMAYIDGMHTEEWVVKDFSALQPHLSEKCVIVFDDCDDRYHGIQSAVLKILKSFIENAKLEFVTFEPSLYRILIVKIGF